MNKNDQLSAVAPLGAEATQAGVAIVRKLAHDVNNALVSAVSTLDLLTIDHPELEETLAPLRHELIRPRALFERPMRGLPTRAMVRPWTLGDWRGRIADEAKSVGVSVRLPSEVRGPAGLDEGQWVQCLDNLVRNALDSHAVHIRTGQVAPDGGRWVSVQVSPDGVADTDGVWGQCAIVDNGAVSSEHAAAAQQRRARSGDGHMGLGLAVVAAHLAGIGGRLLVGEARDGGWRAVMLWPFVA
ncbi:MAG: HAMP domain-containing histidine kinase [Myxococcales bacterium]|nr:HAMP domain-containing histidine kinase [Myxococcales bacterium]